MPSEVTLPNGDVVEFPDGMSDTDIARAVQSHLKPSMADRLAAERQKLQARGQQFLQPPTSPTTNAGVTQGLSDAALTMARGVQAVSGTDPFGAVNQLTGRRSAYEAQYGNNPEAQGGRFVGQMLPAAAAGGGAGAIAAKLPLVGDAISGMAGNSLISRMLSRGAQGAIQGGAGAAAISGQSDEPAAMQAAKGALFGAAGNALVSPVVQAGRSISQGIASLADQAVNKYGLTALRASQLTPQSSLIRKVDQITGQLVGTQGAGEALNQQFNQAALRTAGISGDLADQKTLLAGQRTLGARLDQIEKAHSVQLDDPRGLFIGDLANIEHNATTLLSDAGEQRVVKNAIDTTLKQIDPSGAISGEAYGNLIHKGSTLDKLADQGGNVAKYANDIRDALRDAFQRSLPPDQAALYQETRGQYKNLKTLALAPKDSFGNISPAGLEQAVRQQAGGRAARSLYPQGDLGELAQIGQTFVKSPADSGTPLGAAVLHGLNLPTRVLLSAGEMGAIGGAGYGALQAGAEPLAALAAAGIPLATARLARIPMNSAGLRDLMIGNALGAPNLGVAGQLYQSGGPAMIGAAGQNLLLPSLTPAFDTTPWR